MFLIVKSKGAINMNVWVEFRKCKVLHFPTHGHTWDRLVYEIHETLQPIAIEITTINFDEIEDKHQTLLSDEGVGSVQ